MPFHYAEPDAATKVGWSLFKSKTRHPRPPRFICSSFMNWILGIVSPSLLWNSGSWTDRQQYVFHRYADKLWKYRFDHRTLTREQYRAYAREQRINANLKIPVFTKH